MMRLAEYRTTQTALADFLPWAALATKGVILNKDGSLQRTARFRGPDLDSATPAELVGASARLNNALRRLGSGWAVFVEAQRNPAQAYPHSNFPDPASSLVDFERRAQFEEAGAHYENTYYLTFLYLPPAENASRAEGWLYENRAREEGASARDVLRGFVDRTDRVLQLVEGFVPEVAWLSDTETLTYLHSTVSTKRHRVRVPEVPVHLDAILADEPLIGGLEPRLGRAHVRTLTVMGFPSTTHPGLLDDLNRLAFPYRWMTRAICLDKTDAAKLLTKIRRQWFAKRKSIAAILKEIMTNEASALLDTDANAKALDADAALVELGTDMIGQAYVTATVTVWDEDARLADERLRLVEKVIQGRDFTCMIETVNAVDAWLGSLPGHAYANVRQPPVSTLNLAHMIPLSTVWAGPERDEHFGAPPLLFGKTEGATPFRLSIHVGDVGHTLVVGPTGAGKSVFLALMALQFRRYAGAQVFAFDFGGSIRAAALAMGGEWHDLGGSLSDDVAEPVALQPLAQIDDPAERAWAAGWMADILLRENVAVTPEVKEHLWSALGSLASAPVSERTITGLSVLLQANALKRALQPYTLEGPWGRLLDADAERLGDADVQVFETEGLVGSAVAPAVLAYLFHRIEGRLTGAPTLLIIDEGWLALDDATFGAQLREWLKTLRKKNASVVFATQSLADIETSAIAPAIIESCLTRILLPNERAVEPQITAIYRRFGLNDRQIEILARAAPKRDYYCQSRRGNRLFELGLGEVALAFCAASSKTDQALIANVLTEHGRERFAAAWLRVRGHPWAADMIGDAPDAPTPTASPRIPAKGVCPVTNLVPAAATLRRLMLSGVAGLSLAAMTPMPAHAQLAVFDAGNFSQSVLTAARELQQIENQVTSLQNEAQMLINQGRNLTNLPYSSLQQLTSTIQRTQQLLSQAEGVIYDVGNIQSQFQRLYPNSYSGSISSGQLIADAQSRWQNTLSGFQDALKTQATVVGNLTTTQTQVSALVSSSQGATGALQAMQAGNQLLALQSQQLADVTALLAAQGRAQSLQGSQTLAAQAQAQAQLQRFLAPGSGYQPSTVTMFHN